jgi:hypothetical protein
MMEPKTNGEEIPPAASLDQLTNIFSFPKDLAQKAIEECGPEDVQVRSIGFHACCFPGGACLSIYQWSVKNQNALSYSYLMDNHLFSISVDKFG